MCLIVRSNKNIELTKEFFDNVVVMNHDGWGLMWIQDNKLHHIKSHITKVEELFEQYKKVKEVVLFS